MDEREQTLHTGHRQRRYDSYLRGGLDSFSDIEVLELLLTFAIPRKDTNQIAHGLLERFGAFPTVLEAPVESLQQVKGMTERAAILLHLVPQVWRRYDIERQKLTTVFATLESCADYLVPRLRGAREEQVWMLCLDAKCKLLDCRQISRGSVNSASASLRRIVEVALAVNASSVVLSHNHSSGVALPSTEDVQTTDRIRAALQAVDVVLADHIIVADSDYVSMRDSKSL